MPLHPDRTVALWVFAVTFALVVGYVMGARGEPERIFTGAVHPATDQEGPPAKRVTPRPLDDSDPEMQMLAHLHFGGGGCNREGKVCWEKLGPLRGGGDRLALYLIRQYEETVREGALGERRLLTAVGGTGSREGLRYLRSLIDNPPSPKAHRDAILGLRYHGSHEALALAFREYDRAQGADSQDRLCRAAALAAVRRNLQLFPTIPPGAERRLQDIADRPSSTGQNRGAAQAILREIR